MNLQDTFLYTEIHQQPGVIGSLLADGRGPIEELAARIKKDSIHHIVVAARGTSDNAGRYAQYLLGLENQILVTLTTPSLFSVYQQPPDLKGSLVLGISQSGQSPDLVAVLTEARRQGVPTAAITNCPDSAMAETSDHVIPLMAGVETAVAATKTYTAQLTALAALSAILRQDDERLEQLAGVPDAIRAIFEREENIARLAERFRYMQRCVVIGRGLNYATAFELSIKMKELTYTMVEPYSSADFLHGPIAVIDPGFPAFVVAPSGKLLSENKDFIRQLKELRAEVVVISDDPEAIRLGTNALPLPVPLPEPISPIAAIVPGQVFSMYLAHTRGIDVDHPRGLHKVTETL
ncbi:MAG: SIS domain-containing protein [Chloroflexi bacterium]|nr:SIS domain-containing protein [Anaerolineaceae bacterium]NMB87759.1 SIS domain-containing protein [Chloroflexota bacterium]